MIPVKPGEQAIVASGSPTSREYLEFQLAEAQKQLAQLSCEMLELEESALILVHGTKFAAQDGRSATRRALSLVTELRAEVNHLQTEKFDARMEAMRQRERAEQFSRRHQQLEQLVQTSTNRAVSMMSGATGNQEAKRVADETARVLNDARDAAQLLADVGVPGATLTERVRVAVRYMPTFAAKGDAEALVVDGEVVK